MKRAAANVNETGKKFKNVEITQDLGTILSVSLQNFMCHDHLKFDFDPHINFIVGQNGSGKSAILTGIILALGGKSSVTGRYSNVKGFIKTGKNKARISVTLKNCGPHAYKPEKYGDKIIIEREISIEGVSSYKLKTGEGRIESTHKEELSNILIAMNIQIDNPVLVLTQETSRNFLMAKTGKEEKLYEFFYRGTGIQKLEEEYQLSVTVNEECASDLAAKKQALDVMEKEVKKLENLRRSDEKLDELKRESFWARVMLMEKELEEKEDEKIVLLEVIESTKKEAEESKNKYDEVTLNLEKFKQEKAEVDKKVVIERKALTELGVQSDMCADNVRTCQGQVDRYQREERKLLADINASEEAINEYQKKDRTDYEIERNQRNEEMCRLEEEISNVEFERKKFEEARLNCLQEQNSKNQEINILRAEINDLKYKKNIRVKEHSQLVNSKKNRQYKFGEFTPSILQEIQQNQHKFGKLPKGPIGLDIEVKDPRWNGAVEACIKPNMLRSFCVDNAKDSLVMTQILQKYYKDRMPSIIVSPFLPRVHDVSYHKAQTTFPTVLDMLNIKDPVIANCLIDQLSIENIILIEDTTTAQNVMLDRPPVKCYSAFLLNCDEILLNPYRYYSASRKPTNVLSQTVDENFLVKIQEDINNLDNEIKVKENSITDLRLQLQKFTSQLKALEQQIVHFSTLKSDKLNLIKELNSFEEPRNVPEMQDEYMLLKAELERKQEELKKAKEKLNLYDIKHNEISDKLASARKLVKSLNQTFESLGNKINSCATKKEILDSSKKTLEKALKENERKLPKLVYEIEETDKSIKRTIAKREAVDKKPRIRTKRAYDEIDVQIKETEKVISEQSNTTNKASLLEKYAEKSKRLIEAKNEYKVIEKYNQQITKMMVKREKRIQAIIQLNQFIVNMRFTSLLRSNGFEGHLTFNRKPPSLILQAKPSIDNPEYSKKTTAHSLSGGERSFVTIAFLIALWDQIHMPFRILDEYDVFMDSNNRHLSINLLLRHAEHMSGVQFIFLSPLDLPELKQLNVSVKVHKMQAPQRIGLSNMEE